MQLVCSLHLEARPQRLRVLNPPLRLGLSRSVPQPAIHLAEEALVPPSQLLGPHRGLDPHRMHLEHPALVEVIPITVILFSVTISQHGALTIASNNLP